MSRADVLRLRQDFRALDAKVFSYVGDVSLRIANEYARTITNDSVALSYYRLDLAITLVQRRGWCSQSFLATPYEPVTLAELVYNAVLDAARVYHRPIVDSELLACAYALSNRLPHVMLSVEPPVEKRVRGPRPAPIVAIDDEDELDEFYDFDDLLEDDEDE